MTTPRRLPIAPLAGVRVIRDGTAATIEHDCEPAIAVRLELGARAWTLTLADVFDRYRRGVLALAAATITEPQLAWNEVTRGWQPCGRAIRCVVEAGVDGPIVLIDELELSVAELGGVLARHGAQVCIVFLDD